MTTLEVRVRFVFASVKMASSQAVSHAQRVTRLYRHALKNSLSWCMDRATWREEALRIRARFDANKAVQDRRLAVALVQQGEDELQNKLHPDPYLGQNTIPTAFPLFSIAVAVALCSI